MLFQRWKIIAFIVPGLSVAMLLNGCAVFVIGVAGAAGGYAVSADGIEGISDKSYNHLWETAYNILSQQGSITMADKERGNMKAKIGSSEVKFKLEQATRHSVIVRVQARRWGGVFPDMNLARRVYSMIVHEQGQTKDL